jgi:diphthamide synthase (EF-2-diphthine--ammonia ligase)
MHPEDIRSYREASLAQIPGPGDPCGENGEFHSFVYDGPMFRNKINISVGETVRSDGYVYTDLLPVQ